jgi:hypothetical protein
MTLRVTLEIVPFGNEDKKYTISYIDISNQMRGGDSQAEYSAKKFSDGHTLLTESVDGSIVHNRADGAWELVKKVLDLKGFTD